MNTLKKNENSPIVVLGASSGGLKNFSTVLAKISPKNDFIYVLIQHLDPKHKSQLASLLKKTTTLPVEVILNGMKPEVNHIYVIPSNVELRWVRGAFKLTPRKKGLYEHCTIDVFLESICKDNERKLLGILLSGSNTDGTKGFRSIKKAGAVTLALDPATTIFPVMPQSAISHKLVDKVLPLEKIAAEINKMAKHFVLMNKHKGEDAFAPILKLLEQFTGVDLSQYKQATLHRRINRRMQLNKLSSLKDFQTLLKKNPIEVKKLFEEVTIHVTNFFRDADSFDSLIKNVLPKILRTTTNDPVRVWIPACSTGQEAYSIAMLILESNDVAHSKTQVRIFGTDVSEDSVKKARTGVYTDDEVKEIPEKLLKKYFQKTNNGYKVVKDLRSSCVFAKHDLSGDASFSGMDLICCRNLLIYFNQNNQKKAIHTFNYALKPKGYLFLGHEESLGSMDKLFTVVDRKNSIFQKTDIQASPPQVKSLITQDVRSWETKRGTPFLSKLDHDEFIKLAKDFNTKKIVKTKETPAKASVRLQEEVNQIKSSFEKLVENQSALYEELQATHEEVLASNEELQSKNEEFETTQEELRATNEELRSINDEMVERNQELIRLNEEVEKSNLMISEEKDFSAAIFDTVKEPILILDEKLIVQSANIPFYNSFKVKSKETIGSSLFMLGNNQWDIPELKRFLLDILPHKSSFKDFEIEHEFPRIGKKFISLNARQLCLPHSDRKLILLALKDVTIANLLKKNVQKNLELLELGKGKSDASVNRLQEEKLLREKFVSTLTHDLKNPLTAAIMSSQLIVRDPTNIDKISKHALRITHALYRIESMVTDLLDANQIQAGEGINLLTEPFDAHDLLSQTIEELISVHGNRFKIISQGPFNVESDSKGFRRIIENLVSNAIKYGNDTTNIKVTLRPCDGEMFELNVQNFGPIIESKNLLTIFSQFGRTDSAHNGHQIGWGLGLTLVKGISLGLGGDVSVSSNQVEGTNFRVRLPIHSVVYRNSEE